MIPVQIGAQQAVTYNQAAQIPTNGPATPTSTAPPAAVQAAQHQAATYAGGSGNGVTTPVSSGGLTAPSAQAAPAALQFESDDRKMRKK